MQPAHNGESDTNSGAEELLISLLLPWWRRRQTGFRESAPDDIIGHCCNV